MNKQRGSIPTGVAVLIAIGLVLVTWMFTSLLSHKKDAALTYGYGTSSADPTVDHFLKVDGGFQVGTTTSARLLTFISAGTCSLVADVSVTATSTGTGTCATIGSQTGDQVFVSLATTTTKMAAQYTVIGTVAGSNSTTVRLLNLTGVSAVPSATNGFGSTTQYQIYRSAAN